MREMRAEGNTLQQIADAVGVDPKTVLNNTKGALENSKAVTGRDGKQYPAQYKPRQTTSLYAKDMLDKAAAMQTYAEKLKAGVEIERPIAIGVLKIKAKLGELMPAEKGGRGKTKPNGQPVEFNPSTIAAYRKLAKHADKLERLTAKPPNDRGQGRSGKSSKADCLDFTKPTIAAYRKLAKHANKLERLTAEPIPRPVRDQTGRGFCCALDDSSITQGRLYHNPKRPFRTFLSGFEQATEVRFSL